MRLTYVDPETEQPRVVASITKLEGVFSKHGELTHYCLYTGAHSTEHRRLGFVDVRRVRKLEATLPEFVYNQRWSQPGANDEGN